MGLGGLVGSHDALDEGVADDVALLEVAEVDALDAVEDVDGVQQSGLARVGQVDLGDVAGDDGLGAVAHAGKEHLHLLDGGVLGLVHDDEGVVEGASAHEGQGGDLDDVALEELVDLFGIEQVVEGVVERAQVGVHLFLEGSGKEAEALAGLDRGTDENDAADFFGVEGGDGHGDGEVGFAGAGGADAEDHVVLLDGLDVLALVDGAGLDGALDAGRALLAAVGERTQGDGGVADDQAQESVQFAVVGIEALLAQRLEVREDLADALYGGLGTSDVDGVGAKIDAYAERVFHEAEVFIASPEEGLQVGRDLQGDFQRIR